MSQVKKNDEKKRWPFDRIFPEAHGGTEGIRAGAAY